jgi:hypothetical protein
MVVTHTRPGMFGCSRIRAREPCFHKCLEGGTYVGNKADPAKGVADRSKQPKIECTGPLCTTKILAAIVCQGPQDIAGLDHLAFGHEQVLERFEYVINDVSTTNVQQEVAIGVGGAVGFRLSLGGDPGYGTAGSCLDRCACGRYEVHAHVDAFRVLGGWRRRALGAIIGIHEDFGCVIERGLQNERRI